MQSEPVTPALSRGPATVAGSSRFVPPRQKLEQLLRTGPFHEALRAAIAASGLSLARVQDRLRRLGTDVSLASLSSWQSGRYQPERPRSIDALRAMERFLPVADGALLALLGPPRPRGRRQSDSNGRLPLRDVVPHDAQEILRDFDTRWDSSLTRISCHTRLELDARGLTRSKWTRQLLRADRDGPDRWVTMYFLDEPGTPPTIEIRPPCRPGTVTRRAEEGLLAAEMLFERPLARGETIIVEYTLLHADPRPLETRLETTLHLPVREYVLEARFDPAAPPQTCHFYRTAADDCAADGTVVPSERLLRIDAAGSAHAVALETGPCRIGLRWSWDASDSTVSAPCAEGDARAIRR
jgi:hypothetical protein